MRRQMASVVARQREIAEQGASAVREIFPGWKVTADAVADSTAWAIIKHAEGHEGGVDGAPADLVVVGSHGHGGFKRFVLGSVSQKVVTQVRCSTRISRAAQTGGSPGPVRLIVGVDGSDGANAAVRAIAGRRWPAGTEVFVVTVDEAPLVFDPLLGTVPIATEAGWAKPIAHAAAELLVRAGLKAKAVTAVGFARHVLIDEATERHADCIFVGARGVRAVERFLLGSVSTSIAMNSPCSVEIVHAPPVGSRS
jgi:nucleotide-binding universal stress UspA family protein